MVRGSCHAKCLPMAQRWGNRPAFLWIAERFWVLRFRLMVKRGHRSYGPQASEGEAQHEPFCRKVHRSQIMRKMQAKSLVDLVRIADRLDIHPGRLTFSNQNNYYLHPCNVTAPPL